VPRVVSVFTFCEAFPKRPRSRAKQQNLKSRLPCASGGEWLFSTLCF
jgi:hypothetical protein